MDDDYLKSLEGMRLSLMNMLTRTNALILREKRMRNENIPTEAGAADDPAVPLHSPVEYPNQGKPATNRRARGRRGS